MPTPKASAVDPCHIAIPDGLLPADGRFGSGPSKIRPGQLAALGAVGQTLLGTSHRAAPVRSLVGRVREGLGALLGLPSGYEIALGNGGSSLFWDAAVLGLVRERSQHAVFGEFGQKFQAASRRAPFLAEPQVLEAPPGSLATCEARDDVDVHAWAHNETSTGVISPVERPAGARAGALTLVDGTSAAGGVEFDAGQADVYYFAPQKCLASDGGLWLAALSPAALERVEEISSGGRWIPDSLSLNLAIANSRLDQTLNTPAVATLILLVDQLDWILEHGGLTWAAARTASSAATLYSWALARPWATPFVAVEQQRSPVVGTIDLDAAIEAKAVIAALRANGIVDVDPYRKLGRNQLRVGMYPSVDPADVEALTACVDYVVEQLA